jgi:hypothetical protein
MSFALCKIKVWRRHGDAADVALAYRLNGTQASSLNVGRLVLQVNWRYESGVELNSLGPESRAQGWPFQVRSAAKLAAETAKAASAREASR